MMVGNTAYGAQWKEIHKGSLSTIRENAKVGEFFLFWYHSAVTKKSEVLS